jgi:hypothetical protein
MLTSSDIMFLMYNLGRLVALLYIRNTRQHRAGQSEGSKPGLWKHRPYDRSRCAEHERVVEYCSRSCARPTGVVMVAPPRSRATHNRAASEGRAKCDGVINETARPRTLQRPEPVSHGSSDPMREVGAPSTWGEVEGCPVRGVPGAPRKSWSHRLRSRATRRGRKAKAAPGTMGRTSAARGIIGAAARKPRPDPPKGDLELDLATANFREFLFHAIR